MKLINHSISGALLVAFLATGASAASVVSLAGDKDSFGTDKAIGSTVSVNDVLGSALDAGDGDFDQWALNSFSWSHAFDLAGEIITSASLTIATIDLEDNGAGDGQGGGPFDSLLFIDGVELAGAFDDVFTADGNASTQLTVNYTTFDLSAFIGALADGSASMLLNPFGGAQKDSIAVDFAELTITTAPVPLPAGMPLLLAGLGGFALMRRKR